MGRIYTQPHFSKQAKNEGGPFAYMGNENIICERCCVKKLSPKEINFSIPNYGLPLCYSCQKEVDNEKPVVVQTDIPLGLYHKDEPK